MIDANAFVAATPGEVARQLGDAIHLWRMPWRREQGRAPLLAVLADYLQLDAASLRLETGEHGKPHLPNAHPLRFNWSHSGEFALLALARNVDPGVDIEQPREGVRTQELAERFFAPAEARALANLSESARDASFLQLWSAKEAVLKALGHGLSFGLERIEFVFGDDGWLPDRFDPEAGAAQEWQMLSIRATAGYAGALAWYGPSRRVQAWSLAR